MAKEKWYFLVVYDFDPMHNVFGPFEDEKTCVAAMMADAENEHRIDLEEGHDSELIKHEDIGEAEIIVDRDDGESLALHTYWYAFPIEEKDAE